MWRLSAVLSTEVVRRTSANAVEAGHSLNVSREQAEKAPAQALVFGHVHQQSQHLGGKVVIVDEFTGRLMAVPSSLGRLSFTWVSSLEQKGQRIRAQE